VTGNKNDPNDAAAMAESRSRSATKYVAINTAEAASTHEKAKRLLAVPGTGILTATARVASGADATDFRTGRDLSAHLGLVPREHGRGGKQRW